jgi:hypothetical protein
MESPLVADYEVRPGLNPFSRIFSRPGAGSKRPAIRLAASLMMDRWPQREHQKARRNVEGGWTEPFYWGETAFS